MDVLRKPFCETRTYGVLMKQRDDLIKQRDELLSVISEIVEVYPNEGKKPGWCDRWGAALERAKAAIRPAEIEPTTVPATANFPHDDMGAEVSS